jgi:hypothetical protein
MSSNCLSHACIRLNRVTRLTSVFPPRHNTLTRRFIVGLSEDTQLLYLRNPGLPLVAFLAAEAFLCGLVSPGAPAQDGPNKTGPAPRAWLRASFPDDGGTGYRIPEALGLLLHTGGKVSENSMRTERVYGQRGTA